MPYSDTTESENSGHKKNIVERNLGNTEFSRAGLKLKHQPGGTLVWCKKFQVICRLLSYYLFLTACFWHSCWKKMIKYLTQSISSQPLWKYLESSFKWFSQLFCNTSCFPLRKMCVSLCLSVCLLHISQVNRKALHIHEITKLWKWNMSQCWDERKPAFRGFKAPIWN